MEKEKSEQWRRVSAARAQLVINEPFWGYLALKLKLTEDPTCRTFWTDGVHLGFNPVYASKRDNDELQGLNCEEVMHNADNHGVRGIGKEPGLWNQACDYSILPLVVKSGKKIPADSCYDPKHAGKSAELIYSELWEQRQKQKQEEQEQEEEIQRTDGSGFVPSEKEPDDDALTMPPKDEPGEDEEEGNEEGGGQGEEQESDEESDKPTSGGEVRPPPEGVDPGELEAEWKENILQAAAIAKAAGKLPAGIERIVDEIKNPAIDWRKALRKFFEELAKNDYSWRRPNRRYLPQGVYLPEVRSEQMPPMAMLWDSSGSRDSQEARAECAAECIQIFTECRPEKLYIIYCDDEVQRVDVFEPGDEIVFRPIGGGGTDFRPVFDYIEKENLEICCLVGITDLWGSFPTDAPTDYAVLWCATTNADAPFGDILRLNG